jgi:hypothetical protein
VSETTDVIQGTLDLLILKTLSLEPMHGFGIARRVEQVSRNVFKVNPGSLLVALQRLERGGYIDAACHARGQEAARSGNGGLDAARRRSGASAEGGGLARCGVRCQSSGV